MVEYTVSKDLVIYQNTKVDFPFEITNTKEFSIPVKELCNLVYIDLFFSKSEPQAMGTLSIEVAHNDRYTTYKVSIDEILVNSPLRLNFEKSPEVSSYVKIKITAHYKNEGRISVWINKKDLCATIVASINKKYMHKESPLISIITPLYKTDVGLLEKTLKSVESQYYPKWEWCLVDDGSMSLDLVRYLRKISNKKIKVRINKKNKGIAGATNDALDMAVGQFVCFLDHDDLLTEDALQEVVKALNKNTDADLIYTDEDKVDATGAYHSPFFKPDWNYSLLLSHMYTCHLSVYKKSIIDKIGGIRLGFEGSQDYDFALRFIEKAKKIIHIPKVLYHWRITPGSTAISILNKPLARISAIRALKDHLSRIKRKADVCAGPFQGHHHVNYILSEEPSISIIIPFKDQVQYLRNLIETIEGTHYVNYKLILVDNNSEEVETLEYLKDLTKNPAIKHLKYPKPFNFSAINNYAVKHTESDLILFLNNDTEVMSPDWLNKMAQHFIREDVGAVGAKLLYVDHRIQHAGIVVGVNGIAGHSHKNMWDWQPGYYGRPHIIQEVTAVTGACMMVRRDVFNGVGGFDEKLPKAFNDIDLCLKIRANNYLITYTPYSRLFHHESISRGLDNIQDKQFQKAIQYIDKKWGCFKYKDPYYNPNLTTLREDFTLKV